MKQAIQDAMSRWRATVTGERPPPWNRFWRRERSTLADLNSDVLSSMRGVEAALLQAEGIMKQLDEAAEELFMRVRPPTFLVHDLRSHEKQGHACEMAHGCCRSGLWGSGCMGHGGAWADSLSACVLCVRFLAQCGRGVCGMLVRAHA